MSGFYVDDPLSTKKWQMNNFLPSSETTRYSYTSARVGLPHFNSYERDEAFRVYGYYTDWSQYDARLDSNFADDLCGRGVDMMLYANAKTSYDEYILGFLGVTGDKGNKAPTVANAAKEMRCVDGNAVMSDPWGDLASYRNCGFSGWISNDYYNDLFTQSTAQGAFGGLIKLTGTLLSNSKPKMGISIGGWTFSQPFHFFTADPNLRQKFVSSVLDLLRRFPAIQSLDIDWEYPNAPGDSLNTYGPEDPANFQLLLKELREALDKNQQGNRIEITIAVAADPDKLVNADLALYDEYIDHYNLMTYDFFGTPWSTELAHHTNLHTPKNNRGWSVETAVDTMLTHFQIDPKKINIGYASYSRNAKNAEITSFNPLRGTYKPESTTVGTFESGVTEWYDLAINYLDLTDGVKGKNGFTLYHDDEADADYLYNPTSKIFMSIETPRSVYKKAQYVKQNGLGGIFTWLIDHDMGLLVNAAHEGLGEKVVKQVIDMAPYIKDD